MNVQKNKNNGILLKKATPKIIGMFPPKKTAIEYSPIAGSSYVDQLYIVASSAQWFEVLAPEKMRQELSGMKRSAPGGLAAKAIRKSSNADFLSAE